MNIDVRHWPSILCFVCENVLYTSYLPPYGSTVRNKAASSELFPAPDLPQIPTLLPATAVKETSLWVLERGEKGGERRVWGEEGECGVRMREEEEREMRGKVRKEKERARGEKLKTQSATVSYSKENIKICTYLSTDGVLSRYLILRQSNTTSPLSGQFSGTNCTVDRGCTDRGVTVLTRDNGDL